MSGNTFGKKFKVETFGASHDKKVGCVISGVPIGTKISLGKIQRELDRRKPGTSALVSARREPDKLEVVSGIANGKVIGKKIKLLVRNVDVRSGDYSEILHKPRPGHADLTNFLKFGKIFTGGGRSSGRETVGRVIAGAVAKQLLAKRGIKIKGRIVEVAGQRENFEKIILQAKLEGDSVGGIVEVVATGVPAGLGEQVFDKLDADIAKALMSIPAVKGVEIGAGFAAAKLRGSQNNDPIAVSRGKIITKTNNAGGILGGISTGMPIVARIAVKPTSSIAREQDTIDLNTMEPSRLKITGRHDPCICPRVVPVAEAMLALVIIDHMLRSKKL